MNKYKITDHRGTWLYAVALLATLAGLWILAACVTGYVANLKAIALATAFDPMTVVRIVGAVFAPLGAILGWM